MSRSSGFRATYRPRLPAPSGAVVLITAFVPGYSGGSATDLHRLPKHSPSYDIYFTTPYPANVKKHHVVVSKSDLR